ncbi:hypothetical protein [Minwuia sp.]|uniref:hypothetical protein n=1 Tax=Minwuia sp. TaxID=2493630 RepID=UPI003A8FE4AB
MTDASRWTDPDTARRPAEHPADIAEAPVERPAPPPAASASTEPERPADATGTVNVDTSLRDRISRLSRRPSRTEMDGDDGAPAPLATAVPDPEPAQPTDTAFSFTPAGRREPVRESQRNRDEETPRMRQSARRRTPAEDSETRVPARRASSDPEVRTTDVRASETEVEVLRGQVQRLEAEIRKLQETVATISSKSGPAEGQKGIGAVERALQRLSERVDRLDGGASSVRVEDNRQSGKRGFLGLFGR